MRRIKLVFISLIVFLCLLSKVLWAEGKFPLDGRIYRSRHIRDIKKTYMIKGEISHLYFHLWGEKGKIDSPKLILELPEGIKVLCAWHGMQAGGSYKIDGIISEDSGEDFVRWIIPLRKDILEKYIRKGPNKWSRSNLFIIFETGKDIKIDKANAFWYLETNGQKGKEKPLEINIIPPLGEVKKPSRIKFYFYGPALFNCPDEDIWERIFSLFDRINIKGGVRHFSVSVGKKLAKRGWQILDFGGEGWGGWAGGYWGVRNPNRILKPGLKVEDIIITLRNGKKSKNRRSICPTYMIENSDPGEVYFEEVKKRVKECYWEGVAGMINDYEIAWEKSEVSPTRSCFCPRCKKAFAKFSNLNPEEIENLTPSEILSKYKSQWLKFRHWQLVKMMDIYNRAVKAVDPKLKSVVSSAPLTWSNYPIKVKNYDKYIDEHWPMAYKTGPSLMSLVEVTCKGLKKTVVPILAGEYYGFPAEEVYMNIIAACSSGAKSIAYFPGDFGLNGSYIKAFAKASDKLFIVENFYLDGERIDKSVSVEKGTWDVIRYRVHKLKNKILITLFNYTPDNSALVKISLQEIENGEYFLYDPIDRILFQESLIKKSWSEEELKDGFSYKIPENTIEFLVISKEEPEEIKDRIIGREIEK